MRPSFFALPVLPRPAWTLLTGDALFWLAEGLVFPYLLVYLHAVRHIDALTAGLLISWVGLCGLLVTPLAGRVIDRSGPRAALVLGLMSAALGATLLANAHTIPVAALALTALGVGVAATQPATASMLVRLVPEQTRSAAFSLRYVGTNVGVGVGGVLGSNFVNLEQASSFTALYAAQGAILVAYALLAVRLTFPAPVTPRIARAEAPQRPAALWRDRALRAAWLMMLLAMSVGVMQLANGFAYYALSVLHLPARTLGLALGLNALLIIVFQMPVTRRLAGRRRTSAMKALFVCWTLAWLAVIVTAHLPASTHAALIVTAALLFGAGEMMMPPSLAPLVVAIAPEKALGQYNAALSFATILGKTLAPLPASFFLASGNTFAFFAVVLLGCILGVLVAASAQRHLPAKANVVPAAP